MENWHDLGVVEKLRVSELREVSVGDLKIALSYRDGKFGAVSGMCNHAGGPLGRGCLKGDYISCPWHYWKFHRITGEGEPGFEEDRVPRHELKEENGHLWLKLESSTTRNRKAHDLHPLARPVKREDGPIRVVGISTTIMDSENPRYSTSEVLLEHAISHAKSCGYDAQTIRLRDLKFRNCEGFYSKSAKACTWPCSITQMDSSDQMDQVYEAVVHWADVVLVATPIRWGNASSLYYKMIERMNCIQNAITTGNKILIQDKVASFIITGGQDNVQAVAGQMLGFFSELGFNLPPFPYVAHSLGWTAENMERNINYVEHSKSLREAAEELVCRAVDTSRRLLEANGVDAHFTRSGRKGFNSQV